MHARAGRQALPEDLIDLDALIGAYGSGRPDMADPAQRVVFGTSGHRGSALDGAFTESHILAIAQAVASETSPNVSRISLLTSSCLFLASAE